MSNQIIKSKAFKDVIQSDAVKARLKEILGDRGPQFAAALVQIVNGSRKLQACEPNSILGAALTAASLDLTVDPNIGEAHIVPYGGRAQFQIGYRGFIQLAMRSGQYKALGSCVVYEGELLEYDELTGELVIKKDKSAPPGPVIGYAAKFKLINGFERGEFWTVDEIERHASRYSKAYRYAKGKPDEEASCLWCTDRDAMALKTVEKSLLAHYGPKSIQMQKAIKMDGGSVVNADTGEVEFIDNDPKPEVSKPDFGETDVTPVTVEAEVMEEKPKAEPKSIIPNKEPEKIRKQKADQPTASSGSDSNLNKPKAIRGLMRLAKVTEDELLSYLREIQLIDDSVKTLDEIAASEPNVLDMVYDKHDQILSEIITKKGTAE